MLIYSSDFTAVYYVELNIGFFEILHINDGTNAKKMNLKQCDNFNYAADQYAVQYLYGKERQEFKDWISTGHLKDVVLGEIEERNAQLQGK